MKAKKKMAEDLRMINDSIVHHATNLARAKQGKYDEVGIYACDCPLCNEYLEETCIGCPVNTVGDPCGQDGSTWRKLHTEFVRVWEDRTRKKVLEDALIDMLGVLFRVREETMGKIYGMCGECDFDGDEEVCREAECEERKREYVGVDEEWIEPTVYDTRWEDPGYDITAWNTGPQNWQGAQKTGKSEEEESLEARREKAEKTGKAQKEG